MKKILYVEDDDASRNLVVRILYKDYEIDTAENATKALIKIKDNFYHLFLLDINLGGGETGIDIMKQIREYSHYKNTPIIAITAYTNLGTKEYFLTLGFSHFISKPFVQADLIETIEKALQNSELQS
jgi:CheY-like chemotaxis protein